MEDDDFMKFIKRNFKSLKHRDNLEDQVQQYKPAMRRKMNNILYPQESVLDSFLIEQGMHKKLKSNVKIVNGVVKLNPLKKKRKSSKKNKDDEDGDHSSTKPMNFFEKQKLKQQKLIEEEKRE
jgi:hypothetical protein